MCSRAGPVGEVCRVISMGMVGLRYFTLGSISRQNLLVRVVSICIHVLIRFGRFGGVAALPCTEKQSRGFMEICVEDGKHLVGGSETAFGVPWSPMASDFIFCELHADLCDFFWQHQCARSNSYP